MVCAAAAAGGDDGGDDDFTAILPLRHPEILKRFTFARLCAQ